MTVLIKDKQPRSTWWLDIFFLTLLMSIFYFVLLGTRPLFVPDEGRYAEIAREMAASGDFVTPYLNQIKYFEKPILFYWLGAAAIKVVGVNIWAVRLPNAILGIFGCLFTYAAGRKLYDRLTGLLAACVLGTSTLYFIMAHMVSLDLPVTVFITSCLYAFLIGIQQPMGNGRRLWMWSAAAFAALAVLTKGLIGIVFPGMIIGCWILLTNQWRLLGKLYLISSLLLFFLIAAPWHVLVSHRNPEFFHFYFIEQQFLRYTQKDIGHYQPNWFFIPALIAGFFPWIVFLPQVLGKHLADIYRGFRNPAYRLEIFLVLWATFIFLFFSFSKSKLIPYILPVIPPLAMLTARYLAISITNQRYRGLRAGYFVLLVLTAGLGIFSYRFLQHALVPDPTIAGILIYTATGLLFTDTRIAMVILPRGKISLTIFIAGTAAFLLLSLAAFPYLDSRSIQPLAQTLQPMLQADDEVISYNQYYQDLPFYLQRRVSIVNWQNELSFGMAHQETGNWMIDKSQFMQRLQDNKRIFVIMSKESFMQWQKTHSDKTLFLLNETLTNVLVSNKNSNFR